MKATNIIYIILILIIIGMLIYSIIKNKRKPQCNKSNIIHIAYMNKGWIYVWFVTILIYILIYTFDTEFRSFYGAFWIIFSFTYMVNMPVEFIICEDGIYFNNLCKYSILFVPYEKVDSWHFNKFEKRKLLIETKEKSEFYKLQELKIKEEEVDIITDLLLKYCGEKKDR